MVNCEMMVVSEWISLNSWAISWSEQKSYVPMYWLISTDIYYKIDFIYMKTCACQSLGIQTSLAFRQLEWNMHIHVFNSNILYSSSSSYKSYQNKLYVFKDNYFSIILHILITTTQFSNYYYMEQRTISD